MKLNMKAAAVAASLAVVASGAWAQKLDENLFDASGGKEFDMGSAYDQLMADLTEHRVEQMGFQVSAQFSWMVAPDAPFGPGSNISKLSNHPVVHVSWNDAKAFAKWAGGRLPTEQEWEHAARGGLGDVKFPWGDQEPNDTDFFPCNIWQGEFPKNNLFRDGYLGSAPVSAFAPNGYGLYNMIGNVWEYTSQPFKVRSLKKTVKRAHAEKHGYKLLKGGSFLCHASYCYRYRIAARMGNSANSSTSHQGFRLVYDDIENKS